MSKAGWYDQSVLSLLPCLSAQLAWPGSLRRLLQGQEKKSRKQLQLRRQAVMTQTLNPSRAHPSLQPMSHSFSAKHRCSFQPRDLSQEKNPVGLRRRMNICATVVSCQTGSLVTVESNWEQYFGVEEDAPGSEVSRLCTWADAFQGPGKDLSEEFWWYLRKWKIFVFFFIKKTSLWYEVQPHKDPVLLNYTLYNTSLSLKDG